ncbi:MAG: hypothetical protein ABI977_29265 [Acidobacteriota bacterium]
MKCSQTEEEKPMNLQSEQSDKVKYIAVLNAEQFKGGKKLPLPTTQSNVPSLAITLRYPRQWFTPVHPFAEHAEEQTRQWLAALGLLDSAQAQAKFRHLGVARYGGWPLYNTDPEALVTITRFLTLWIYYDDMLEGLGEGREELAVSAIRGDGDFVPPEGGSAHLKAWWQTALRYRQRMSADWCAGMGEMFREWLGSVKAEAEQLRRLRAQQRYPSTEEYLECRRTSIGVYPTLCLLEYAIGQGLPTQMREHPAMRQLMKGAAEMVLVQNDMVSVAKDAKEQLLNLYFCLSQDHGQAEAICREIERLHDHGLKSFLNGKKILLQEFAEGSPEGTLLRKWITAAETMCHGFARWHVSNTRYAPELRLGEAPPISIQVEYIRTYAEAIKGGPKKIFIGRLPAAGNDKAPQTREHIMLAHQVGVPI